MDPAAREARPRKYRSAWLERISRLHPAWPFGIWLPVVALALGLALRAPIGVATIGAWLLAGGLAWTLAEYLLHRWVLHWVPESAGLRSAWHPVHQVHHAAVEWDRTVAHPMFTLPIGVLFFLGFRAALGSPAVYPFFAGFLSGYLVYEWLHFRAHFGTPRTELGRALRRHHLQHHFARDDRWYGVTSPLWDYVFGTQLRRGERSLAAGRQPLAPQ